MGLKFKIIILSIIIIFGLLLNYEEVDSSEKIFSTLSNPSLSFISLYKNEISLFEKEISWGYPFPYWSKNKFNLKFLVFNLIFYLILWGIICFILWFIKGVKRMQERRLKPPKFRF